MDNKELYHYGRRAKQNQRAGYFAVVFYGFIGIIILLAGFSVEILKIKVIMIIVGVFFLILAGFSMKKLINADAERHDYKMRSGTILYGEDD